MNRFYFYTEWTFKAIPEDLDSRGPYHSTHETDSPNLVFDWVRMERVLVVQFDSKEEMEQYWNSKTLGEKKDE